MSLKLTGISACQGYVIAKAYKIVSLEANISSKYIANINDEISRLDNVFEQAENELIIIKNQTKEKLGIEESLIFEAQIAMLKDPDVYTNTVNLIKEFKYSAPYSYKKVMQELIDRFINIDNPYIKTKATDINDVLTRVLNHFNKQGTGLEISANEPVILVADDLSPSQTVNIDKSKMAGIITAQGSKTSHTAILAKSINIPAVVGLSVLSHINTGDLLIVDGNDGYIIVNPTDEEIRYYEEKINRLTKEREGLKKYIDAKSLTKDNYQVKLMANLNSPAELNLAKNLGSEGIGLFRTEYIYMQSLSLPSEEEQLEKYLEVLNYNNKKEVVIRTFDIGGDKNLIYLPTKNELNPFLGYRALRRSLTEKELFITQIRAMLKANTNGNLGILLPMVSTLEELLQAKKIIKETEEQLLKENVEVKPYKLGIMIEVPAAALMIEDLIHEVDFVSLGTNDLIQYLFAADRMNENVSYLYQPFHPVVLNIIKRINDVCRKYKKEMSVCGEMAAHTKSGLLLVGLGVDILSMHPHMIARQRKALSKINFAELKRIADQALKLHTNDEVKTLMNRFVERHQLG